MPRMLAIVNGTKRGARAAAVHEALLQRGIEVVCTERPGHAAELARAAGGYDGIVAAGGDGTVSEVLCGMDTARQWLAIVQLGTVNCIAGTLGVARLESALAAIDGGATVEADVMDVAIRRGGMRGQRRFLGFLALGFEARLTRLACRWRRLPAPLRYGAAALVETLLLRALDARVSTNGSAPQALRFTSFVINNCGAESFSTLPSSRLDDGALEVQAVRRSIPAQYVHNFVRFARVPWPRSWRVGVRALTCELERPQPMMADGELLDGITGFDVRMRRGALRLRTPPTCPPVRR
jgi:diacylglycerol kinase family enzyme